MTITARAAKMTTERKAAWQFNQEELPRPTWRPTHAGWNRALKDGTRAAWERAFQQAVYDEASRCLNVIAYEDPDMTVEAMPAAVKDVAGHLFLLGRGWRWGALGPLLEEFEEIAPVFWPLFMRWWPDGEADGPRSVVPMIKRAIEWDLGRLPHDFMEPEDKAFLDALPETVTVYRGTMRPGRRIGISWTTDKAKAEWFARRFAFGEMRPVLFTGRVRKSKIIACFTGRNESEVLT